MGKIEVLLDIGGQNYGILKGRREGEENDWAAASWHVLRDLKMFGMHLTGMHQKGKERSIDCCSRIVFNKGSCTSYFYGGWHAVY